MIPGLFIELMRLQNKAIIKLENLMLKKNLLVVNVIFVAALIVANANLVVVHVIVIVKMW